jgi:hypothetical protein
MDELLGRLTVRKPATQIGPDAKIAEACRQRSYKQAQQVGEAAPSTLRP